MSIENKLKIANKVMSFSGVTASIGAGILGIPFYCILRNGVKAEPVETLLIYGSTAISGAIISTYSVPIIEAISAKVTNNIYKGYCKIKNKNYTPIEKDSIIESICKFIINDYI